jgi:DNA polymerase-3 subunit delta'
MEEGMALATLLLQWLYCPGPDRPCGTCRTCLQVAAHTHADTVWIEPEKKSRVISIDQIRAASLVLNQTSYEGGWKAAVLTEANRMTEAAANAFLKTLEEPPPRCLLLLVTDSPQALLATIQSRCQRVTVGAGDGDGVPSPVAAAMLDWLRQRERGAAPALQAAWISGILGEVRDGAEKIEKERADELVDDETLKARIQSRVVEARLEVLRMLYRWERDLVAVAAGAAPDALEFPAEREHLVRQAAGLSVADGLRRVADVERAARLLAGNVPEGSVWEAVLPV